MAEQFYERSSDEMYISDAEAAAVAVVIAPVIGLIVALEGVNQLKEMAERSLLAYAKSEMSMGGFLVGSIPLFVSLVAGEKIGEGIANLGEKAGVVPPLKHPEKADWRIPLRGLLNGKAPLT